MPGTPQTQTEWEQTVARRVMERTRSTLYIALRYLNAPLGALAPTPDPDPQRGLATNGAQLFYGASWALRLYRNNRRYLQRAYLHSLFHCLFRHPWLRGSRDKALWGLACDIAVEQVLDHLGVPSLQRPVGWLRQETYTQLQANCRFLAAGPIYRALADRTAEELDTLQREFL